MLLQLQYSLFFVHFCCCFSAAACLLVLTRCNHLSSNWACSLDPSAQPSHHHRQRHFHTSRCVPRIETLKWIDALTFTTFFGSFGFLRFCFPNTAHLPMWSSPTRSIWIAPSWYANDILHRLPLYSAMSKLVNRSGKEREGGIVGTNLFCFFAQCSTSQRPYKVWSSDRQKRKSITAANLSEFKTRAAEKLGYEEYTRVRVVLESDGTEVEDDCYFQSAEKDTVFLLLRDSECWQPPGLDAFKAGMFHNRLL